MPGLELRVGGQIMPDWLLILAVVVGVGAALALYFVENAFDRLMDALLGRLGWHSGSGPLAVEARREGERIALVLENRGQGMMKAAALEACDAAGTRHFPRVHLTERGGNSPSDAEPDARAFAGLRLPPRGTCTVWLEARELEEGDFRSLAVLDDRGRSWPVLGTFRAAGK